MKQVYYSHIYVLIGIEKLLVRVLVLHFCLDMALTFSIAGSFL